jgi:hypothetical protein
MAPSTSKCSRCHSIGLIALLAMAAAAGLAAAAATPPSIEVLATPAQIEASVMLPDGVAIDAAPETLLWVAIVNDDSQPGPPMLGTYKRAGTRLTFRPRFPLARGARYRIGSIAGAIDHVVPAAESHSSATVAAIHPAAAELPANLLKFYLHFSRPMREGREVFTRIHLLDSREKPIEAPWRDTELWTADARRLTLWIHPGRVKRGVNLREELGPVLRPGESYTLLIDADLRDAEGQPLGRAFRHTFRAAPEIHARLDLEEWKSTSPASGTREPLRVVAPRPIDHALALRCLHVRASGVELEGHASLAPDERTWTFVPAQPWQAIEHEFLADPWLEDLAGNTFIRVFDSDLTEATPVREPTVSRNFTPVTPPPTTGK